VVAPFVALALEGTVDLGGDRKPHLAAEHDGIFGRQAVQPDDLAVEALCDHQRGVENRPRGAVPDHGQQILHAALPALARTEMERGDFAYVTYFRRLLRGPDSSTLA